MKKLEDILIEAPGVRVNPKEPDAPIVTAEDIKKRLKKNIKLAINQTNVYSDSGVADYTTYASDAASQNTGEYINSIDDWFTNETFYSNPRRVELGMRYDF